MKAIVNGIVILSDQRYEISLNTAVLSGSQVHNHSHSYHIWFSLQRTGTQTCTVEKYLQPHNNQYLFVHLLNTYLFFDTILHPYTAFLGWYSTRQVRFILQIRSQLQSIVYQNANRV